MNKQEQAIVKKLKDERSKKVVFLSHCLLNENTRYLGGAFRPAYVSEVLDELRRHDLGIVQMPCPEQRAWGGVLKRQLLLGFGMKGSWLYPFRGVITRLFEFNSKRIFKKMARQVVEEIRDYLESGFEVHGIVGVIGSPVCGVGTTLDMRKTFDYLAGITPETLDRNSMNTYGIANCLADRDGWFFQVLKQKLQKKGIEVPMLSYDFLSELNGEEIHFVLNPKD